MALLVEYKCDQTILSIYQFKNKIYQAYKYKGNVSMQDINTSEREREKEIANTKDLFRGSSTLALRPRLQHYEGFPLKTDTTGLLGAATPTSEFILELFWTL